MSERAPFPASMGVADARDAYLRENGFTFEEYSAPRTKVFLFGFTSSVPNTEDHARGIMLHDLHHVATGFGTDLSGEGEVSAFEARGGLAGLGLYVRSLVLLGVATGILVAPMRTLRAFRLAWRCRSLFADRATYEDLARGTVGELRARMGLPLDGIAGGARGLHSNAPVSAPSARPRTSAACRGAGRAAA
jgi:hypothetical protein